MNCTKCGNPLSSVAKNSTGLRCYHCMPLAESAEPRITTEIRLRWNIWQNNDPSDENPDERKLEYWNGEEWAEVPTVYNDYDGKNLEVLG